MKEILIIVFIIGCILAWVLNRACRWGGSIKMPPVSEALRTRFWAFNRSEGAIDMVPIYNGNSVTFQSPGKEYSFNKDHERPDKDKKQLG